MLKEDAMMVNGPSSGDDRPYRHLHDELEKMIADVCSCIRDKGVDDRIYIDIKAEQYLGKPEVAIEYNVSISMNDSVKSDNLYTSAKVVTDRYIENDALNTKLIPLYKEREA